MSAELAAPEVRRTPGSTPLLSMRGINKSFGAVHVLYDVDFDVFPGEVTALVGDNGAGKTTLIKAVAGIYPVDSGEIIFEGHTVSIHDPKQASTLGIEVVYQDLALCDNLDVVHNMFLGREQKRAGVLDESTMELRARDTLNGLSVRTLKSVRQAVASLSGGQRQTVAIARSLLGKPKVVMLDEPTAALGVAQTAEVLNLVERLRENGLAVILISHNMSDVMAVADRVVVLRLGRNNGEFRVADTNVQEIIAAITGATTNAVSARAARKAPQEEQS